MTTSRSLLSLALVTLALIGCKPTSAPQAEESTAQPRIEDEVPVAEPAEGAKDELFEAREKKSIEEAPGGGGSPAPMDSLADAKDKGDRAAATDIITVADAGASSVGRDNQAAGNFDAPESDPEEKGEAEEDRPALPKPVFGDTAKTSCRKQLEVGNKLKSFKLTSVDGKKTISSSGYRKRVVLVNFWATWCKPCIKELPDLDRLYRKYRNNGMTFVAIATDEEAEGVQKIVDDLKLAAKVAIGGEQAAGSYDHPNFPFSFVVDGDGKIVAAYDKVDESCLADLESVIRDELEKLP